MKKFLFATLATTTMVSAAHAGSLNFDARADYDTSTYEGSTQKDSNKFYFKTIRLNYEGKVNEELSFRLRGAYNKDANYFTSSTAATNPGTKVSGTGDNTQPALEFAYITHKMNDWFSLQVGKIGSEYGAIESTTSGADLYLTSQAYTKVGPNGNLNGLYLGTTSLLYVVGAKAIFTITPDQNISLVVFKTPEASTGATAPAAQATTNASMQGLIYKGAFLDKSLKVMASYHQGSGATTADKYELASAGFTWAFAGTLLAGIDYTTSSFKADASDKKDSIYSVIGKIAYTGWEQWTPRLEIVSSEEKVETNSTATNNGTNKFLGYGAVVEYKPITDANFRYHVAYSHTTEELADSTKNDAKVDQITVGARLYADFLK